MRDAFDALVRLLRESDRARNVAQNPQDNREEKRCSNTGVLSEAKGDIVVPAGLEQGDRAFEMLSRLAILAGEPMGRAGHAMGDAGFDRVGSRRDVL